MSNQLASCPVCNSSKISYWGKTSGRITLHDSWWRCVNCTLLFANPLKSSEEIKHFYAHDFYEEKKIDPSKEQYHQLFQWLTDIILKWKEPKSVLEIGCGKGLFLKYFSKNVKPNNVVGIEFDKSVTDQIKLDDSNFIAYNDYYENVKLDQKFDLIFFWHVIEHVIDVHAFLDKIKGDLSDDGVAVLGTPAFGYLNSLKAWIQNQMGRTVTVGTSSDHTYFFSDKVLRNIIESHGLEVLYQKVYIDNVNEEMSFTNNRLKAVVMYSINLVMTITGLPLFGKQIMVIKKL